jgi:hypothetical protein
MSIPTISHPTDRPNFTRVSAGGITYWFSYRTVIAFQRDNQLVVRKNMWGPTTGKHLNYIDDGARSKRVDTHEFYKLLSEAEES